MEQVNIQIAAITLSSFQRQRRRILTSCVAKHATTVEAMNKTIPPHHVRVKRAYEAPAPEDGARILIDRLWPRGVRKEHLALAEWDKELSPSTELRQWYGHEPARWDEFRRRYAAELRAHADRFDALRERARQGVVTLVFSSHEEKLNNAGAMREFLLHPGGLDDVR